MNYSADSFKIFYFLLFIFFFFFLLKVIDRILYFYDISVENAYSFIIWFSIIFLLMVILPAKPSNLVIQSSSSKQGAIETESLTTSTVTSASPTESAEQLRQLGGPQEQQQSDAVLRNL